MPPSASVWRVHNKLRVLQAVMRELRGNAEISFEGNLHGLSFGQIAGASTEETTLLKRHTIWPKQDFFILPLETSTETRILDALGGTFPGKRILHVQIGRGGVLEFAAYDQFAEGCVVFGPGLSSELFKSLISEGVLERKA